MTQENAAQSRVRGRDETWQVCLVCGPTLRGLRNLVGLELHCEAHMQNPCRGGARMVPWKFSQVRRYIFHLEATVADAGNAQSYTDVCGGSISVHSPLSGTELARCDAFHVDRGSFVPAVRAMCAEALQHPPFAMTFLEQDQIMAEDVTWCDLGRPHSIQVVLHPQANLWNRKLILAVKEDCAQSVRLYLQRGQSPNTKYHTGFTALSRSVYLNSMSACAILLQGRADPNLRDASGQSCLHIARGAAELGCYTPAVEACR